MKTLTLTQPYATLITLGRKRIETRPWRTNYRGPLLIHAAKGLGPVGGPMGLVTLCVKRPFVDVLIKHGITLPDLPRGAIVAVCELVDCVPTANTGAPDMPTATWRRGEHWWLLSEQENAFGDYSSGRYAFLLADIRALPEPIPAKGALGLWEYDGELLL